MTGMNSSFVSALICVIAGVAGAVLFGWIGFPAAALTGSSVAVSVVCLLGARLELPIWLRDLFFVVLGINIGTGATSETLAAAAHWPATIALVAVSVFATLGLGRWVLVKALGYDKTMATLAATPGHLSFVLGIAADRNIEVAPVAIIQSIRVLFITIGVPAAVTWGFEDALPVIPGGGNMTAAHLGGLTGAAILVGWVFKKLHFPAAFLLAGMVVSAVGHVGDVTPGRLPWGVLTIAMIAMGALIGSRFSGVSGRQLRTALIAGVSVTMVGFAVTLLCVAVAAHYLGLSVPLLIVALVPGGVEAMAAIAFLLGYDPAFVAAHHLARLFILSLVMPIWARRVLGR